MDSILFYFENIPTSHRSMILVLGISFFWMLEGFLPLVNFKYNKIAHAIPNLFFTLTTILINFGLAFLLVTTSDWVVNNNFGIINLLFDSNLLLYTIFGVLLLDLIGAYLPHFVEHKIKYLWMIHLVHHTDHSVDTTTANRHHPLESVIRFSFTIFGVIIIGTPIGLIMFYQSLSLISTHFDKKLSYLFVSPDMHKIHHHYKLPYTDSNYGNIFSIWDRVFGTYSYLERDSVNYGVDLCGGRITNSNIWSLLKQPFQKYRKPTN